MKFKIHFEHKDGTDDFFIIEADSIAEIQSKAQSVVEERGINEDTCWSEELTQ
jgi:hypothetical protein